MTAAVALTCLSALAGVAQGVAESAAQGTDGTDGTDRPAGIVAAKVRAQGHACSAPVAAARDREASQADAAVWILSCGNARYRVRLVPDMAAQVSRLD